MSALVRQEPLEPAKKKDLDENVAYFRKRTCSRDDLCGGWCTRSRC
jgi:hypothetical protein